MDDEQRKAALNKTQLGKAALKAKDKSKLYESIDLALREAWKAVEGEQIKDFLNWLARTEINLSSEDPPAGFFHTMMVNNGFDDLIRRYRESSKPTVPHRSLLARLLRRTK